MILLFCRCCCVFLGAQGQEEKKEDTHTHISVAQPGFFTLCPAYIKHALLLQLEQKGKQCHQVKFLRIPQTPRQIDLSPNRSKEESYFVNVN